MHLAVIDIGAAESRAKRSGVSRKMASYHPRLGCLGKRGRKESFKGPKPGILEEGIRASPDFWTMVPLASLWMPSSHPVRLMLLVYAQASMGVTNSGCGLSRAERAGWPPLNPNPEIESVSREQWMKKQDIQCWYRPQIHTGCLSSILTCC